MMVSPLLDGIDPQSTLVSILNWNSTSRTIRCLEQIDRRAAPHFKFMVLDNGSRSDPVSELRARFPDIFVDRVPRNLGFTGGHNHVISLALQRNLHSVLLLNNDCDVTIDGLTALRKQMDERPNAAAVSSLIYRSGPVREPMMVAGHIDWATSQSIRPPNPGADTPPGCPPLIVGTSLLLRNEALKTIGLLDDDYFAYYDDNDLSARFFRAGLGVEYCAHSVCLHDYRPVSDYSPMVLYLMSRNRAIFWNEHTPVEFRAGLERRLEIQFLRDVGWLLSKHTSEEGINAMVAGRRDARRGLVGPPPDRFEVSYWEGRMARVAPYFRSRLLEDPAAALHSRLRSLLRPRKNTTEGI